MIDKYGNNIPVIDIKMAKSEPIDFRGPIGVVLDEYAGIDPAIWNEAADIVIEQSMDYDHLISVPSDVWNDFADTQGFNRPFEDIEDDGFITVYHTGGLVK